jgi:hypothetical protein
VARRESGEPAKTPDALVESKGRREAMPKTAARAMAFSEGSPIDIRAHRS